MTTQQSRAKKHPTALVSFTPDGEMIVPETWTGFYSQLSFKAEETSRGVLMQVCLDQDASVHLDALCEDGETFLETLDILDVCLAAAKGIDMKSHGIDLTKRLPAIGALLELLENPEPSQTPRSRKGKTIRTTLAKHLRSLLNTLSKELLETQKDSLSVPSLS